MDMSKWCYAPKDLLASKGFVSKKTGELIKLTPAAKLVLIYMMDRHKLFIKKLKGKHYETQVSIGRGCGIEWKAAAKALKLFIDNGILLAEKKRDLKVSNHSCWYYYGLDLSVELYGDFEFQPETQEHKGEEQEEPPIDDDFWVNYQEQELESTDEALIEYFGGCDE